MRASLTPRRLPESLGRETANCPACKRRMVSVLRESRDPGLSLRGGTPAPTSHRLTTWRCDSCRIECPRFE
jgi:hypothetical protein